MSTKDSYKLPTIIISSRDDLVEFLQKTSPKFVFEQVEEVTNPRGRQWEILISTKIELSDIGVAIVEYKESMYEPFDASDQLISSWLKKHCCFIENIYKGRIKS